MINIHDHVALLIDAENAQLSYIEQVLKISDYHGELKISRAYGDWNEPRLFRWCEKIDALNIERIQVDRVGKNATDHRLLVDAGEILGANTWENDVNVFIIVSGDGGFTSAFIRLQEKGRKVIGIANRGNTAIDLRESCYKFYDTEDLDHHLIELEKRHPIPPREVRKFYNFLFHAYHHLTRTNEWLSYDQLDEELRNITPDYDSKFGRYTLSEWLKIFPLDFERSDQEQVIRRIDPTSAMYVRMLLDAYEKGQLNGRIRRSELGKALPKTSAHYQQHFGSKKLSQWLEEFQHIFKFDENYVWLRSVDIAP